MKLAAFASVAAFLLALAVAAPAHAADIQPTPPPVRDLTPASPAPPPPGVTNLHTDGSTCGGWYLQKEYGYNWPAATTWWEAECTSYDPACWPACEPVGNVSYLIDFYYWDGSSAVFYGERYHQDWSTGAGCQYWWDSATGLQYQFDTPACPWTGPGNAAPYPGWRFTCSAVYDCTFDGTDSFASDGIASYAWDFGDGTRGQGAIAQHSYASLGTYQVTMTITDNGGLVAETSSPLRIDIPPIASFTYTCSSWKCTFDGSASSDPDGTIQQYYWNFGDGGQARGSIAQHAYWKAGSYTAALWVYDDAGFYANTQQTVVISEPNLDVPPVASFVAACMGRACWFDPSASHDPDGTIIEYDWAYVDANGRAFDAGYTHTPSMAYITFPSDGTWTVTLTVIDDGGVKGSTSQTLLFGDRPPTAAFTWTCTGLVCNFDGGASGDPDGSIQSYSWDFGDGSLAATTTSAQHSYANFGTYTVSLTVTDNAGLVGTVSMTVTVVATTPTASFTVTCTGGSCTFDAGASSDVGGTLTTYSWTFGDGTSGQGKVVQHTYSATKTYSVALTVTDSGGSTATTSTTASAISLSATAIKAKNQRQVSLSWSGSNAAAFDVYRNGVRIAMVSGASYTDTLSKPGTYDYMVCEAGSTSMCSNSMSVSI